MFTPHIVLCAIQGVAPRLAIDPWGADNIFVAHLCTCLHLYSSFHYLYICIYICHPHYTSTSTWITRKALVCCICPTSINGSMTDHWKATEMRSSLIRMLVELGIGGGSIICILYVWDGADPIRMLLMKLGDGRTQSFADHHSQQTTECWWERHW